MFDYAAALGNAVRQARLVSGLTQAEVAERIDVDVRTVLNIENLKGNPKFEVLVPLIRELNIDPRQVFYPETGAGTDAASKLMIILEQCSAEELDYLLPVCETILYVLRSKQATKIAI